MEGFRMVAQSIDLFPQEGTALVIGGSGGLGKVISLLLAENGSNVALTYRSNKNAAEETVSKIKEVGRRSSHREADLTNLDSVKEAVKSVHEEFGRIHSVIYASGPSIYLSYLGKISPDEWYRVIAGDINGFFNLVHATLPYLKNQGGGAYVNLTAASAARYPTRDALSAVPKASIELLSKAIAIEEGRFGIRSNCVAPGLIETGLGQEMLETDYAGLEEQIRNTLPLRKFGTAQDIAEAVVFLASSRAKFITGQSLAVDGGWQA
jgi:NAD(P)-dependent dehydrogenase (short-subunit alcohol dehydrogenase family)